MGPLIKKLKTAFLHKIDPYSNEILQIWVGIHKTFLTVFLSNFLRTKFKKIFFWHSQPIFKIFLNLISSQFSVAFSFSALLENIYKLCILFYFIFYQCESGQYSGNDLFISPTHNSSIKYAICNINKHGQLI